MFVAMCGGSPNARRHLAEIGNILLKVFAFLATGHASEVKKARAIQTHKQI